jgi:hypothetical protein
MAKITLEYQGRHFNGKTLSHKYINSDSGRGYTFGVKVGGFQVGSLIEVEETEEGIKSPYDFCGFISDAAKISEWKMLDTLAYDAFHAFKESTKKLPTRYENALDDMRTAYKSVPYSQRQIFLNRLIIEITKS